MQFTISHHAAEQMTRRGISHRWVELVLHNPEQRLSELGDKEILQSRLEDEDGKIYLLRLVVAVDHDPPVLVTVYRTSKIEKYWRSQ